jgi:hypothetical protein
VNNYEKTASRIALMNHYDYVVCGHIHQPKIEVVYNGHGDEVMYLNSGDWVENLSALYLFRDHFLTGFHIDESSCFIEQIPGYFNLTELLIHLVVRHNEKKFKK